MLDGDTIDVHFILPFGIAVRKRVRLFGINTPETRTRDPIEKAKEELSQELETFGESLKGMFKRTESVLDLLQKKIPEKLSKSLQNIDAAKHNP